MIVSNIPFPISKHRYSIVASTNSIIFIIINHSCFVFDMGDEKGAC